MPTAIGYHFVDPTLLQLARSHRSWCAENDAAESNERLEFLGDAVLGMVIAEHIYVQYADLPEGQLAKLRAGVVNAPTLAEIAREIDLGEALLLGKGEQSTGGADKQSILADAMEAVIGAVYLDGGLEAARTMVLRLWGPHVAAAVDHGPGGFDHKTRLQEIAAAAFEGAPRYDVEIDGPDHARTFAAQVRIDGEILGEGTGTSKKEAEQAAAGQAVAQIAATEIQQANDDTEATDSQAVDASMSS